MKLGVFTVLFLKKPFEEMLDYVKEAGVEAVEIGTGGYPGPAHCNPDELLEDEGKLK
ncbi:MAG: sugar phosphate isomerase/epimerase, partial [Thermoactinomyces sp.]